MLSLSSIMGWWYIVSKRKTKNKKVNYIYILLISMIVVLLIILGLLIYNRRVERINEANVILYAEDENITIDDSLPVSDKFGKEAKDELSSSYKYLEFEIVNVSSRPRDYQIYITKNSFNTSEINNRFVKLYLMDENNNPIDIFSNNDIPSYVDLNYIKDMPNSKLLYTSKIDKYQKKKFTIKVWVSDNYVSLSKNYFSFDIRTRAV